MFSMFEAQLEVCALYHRLPSLAHPIRHAVCECWSGGRRRGGRRSRSQLSFLLKLHLNHRGVILSTKHTHAQRTQIFRTLPRTPHARTPTTPVVHTIMSSKKAKTSSDDLTAFLAAAEAAAKGAGRMIREAHDSRAKGGAVKGIESKGSEETPNSRSGHGDRQSLRGFHPVDAQGAISGP